MMGKNRYRSVLSFIFAGMLFLLTACSSPSGMADKGPTYTPTQLEQLQRSAAGVEEMRDRMVDRLLGMIEQEDWSNVETFIHGPLGETRIRMFRLARGLEPKLRSQAQAIADEVERHLDNIDEAATESDFRKALTNYDEALLDFESLLRLVPTSIE